jgi:protein-S-isoprenylcysteine O-methyltransferase Ste14
VTSLDSLRYVLALIVLVSAPPALCFWLIVHPFIDFWRRLGAGWTFALVAPLLVALGGALFLLRESLLGVEFGTRSVLVALGGICVAIALIIAVLCRRHLTLRIITGLPELAREGDAGTLLTQGIYARIRHPRYVEVMLGLLGWALFTNYLALYLLVALLVPLIYLVVVLEERELRDRFGAEYEDYCRSVPRFLPRLRLRS